MPPKASHRVTTSRAFDRIEGETAKGYEAFVAYRNMGPDRNLEALRKSYGYSDMVYQWSRQWNWGERAANWDAMIDEKARERSEAYLPIWEQRRQVALERMMLFAAKLMNKAEAMLDHPIVKEVLRESRDGQTHYTIIEPAGWNWSGLATVVRTAAELQAATIAEGLMESDLDAFDVESATEDELRQFLANQKRRAQLRRSS